MADHDKPPAEPPATESVTTEDLRALTRILLMLVPPRHRTVATSLLRIIFHHVADNGDALYARGYKDGQRDLSDELTAAHEQQRAAIDDEQLRLMKPPPSGPPTIDDELHQLASDMLDDRTRKPVH